MTTSPGQLHWVGLPVAAPQTLSGAPLVRGRFTLDQPMAQVRRATLAATAWGVAELHLNGRAVSLDLLEPGWTSYRWRQRYRRYDVTDLLAEESTLVALLGNGWYRGRLAWAGDRALYGDRLALLAQLEIEFADGHVQTVATDASWEAAPSPVLSDDLYDGQHIDARRPGVLDASAARSTNTWSPVEVVTRDLAVLVPAATPPVRRIEQRAPVSVTASDDGRFIVDFGQNLVGWVRVSVLGQEGQEIELRHSEVLENGRLAIRPLRSAQATDRYVLSGGPDVFEPTLTSHGFRYVEVSGWPGRPEPDQLQAVVVHSDLTSTGSFRCSHDLLNRLHDNVRWSARGNFLALPTDCPQRDERLGWTGDISVFAPTAAFMFDVKDFLSDWLRDLAADQRARDGRVPNVVPDVFPLLDAESVPQMEATAVWGDAAVWVPWALWVAYGDRTVLEEQYDSMRSHVQRVLSLRSARGLVEDTTEYGDWLDPDAPPDAPWKAKTDPGLVATACLYRSTSLTAQTAALLGRADDAADLERTATAVRDAFNRHYVRPEGLLTSDAVTAYALAIVFGLLTEEGRGTADRRLVELVEASGFHITTGFAGTPFVCDALAAGGHLNEAYRLLLQTTAPSWLYPVTLGATTIWERWDSLLPDGTVNPGEMTSFNHYALGAVADWIHRIVGGIAPLTPGYESVLIAPVPGGGLTWAEASLESPRGRIAVSWRCTEDEMITTVALPSGVRAIIAPRGAAPVEVVGGRHELVLPMAQSQELRPDVLPDIGSAAASFRDSR